MEYSKVHWRKVSIQKLSACENIHTVHITYEYISLYQRVVQKNRAQ